MVFPFTVAPPPTISCPAHQELTLGQGGYAVLDTLQATATSAVGAVEVRNDFTGACQANTDYTDMVGCQFFWSVGQDQTVTFTGEIPPSASD